MLWRQIKIDLLFSHMDIMAENQLEFVLIVGKKSHLVSLDLEK